MELLLTSPIQDLSIILGKWMGAMLLYLCLLGMSLLNIAFLFAWASPIGSPLWWVILASFCKVAACLLSGHSSRR